MRFTSKICGLDREFTPTIEHMPVGGEQGRGTEAQKPILFPANRQIGKAPTSPQGGAFARPEVGLGIVSKYSHVS